MNDFSYIKDVQLREKLLARNKSQLTNRKVSDNSPVTSVTTKEVNSVSSSKPESSLSSLRRPKNFKVKTPNAKSLALATKQLAAMSKTGLPIVDSLVLVSSTVDDKSLKYVFRKISDGVSKGSSIVDILSQYPQVFDDMYVALVDAGEQGGLLAEVLERESILLEKLAAVRSQVVSAMAYPIGIFVLVIAVVVVMLVFVMPVFAEIYSSSGTELPFLTQILLDASEFLRNLRNTLFLILGIAASAFAFSRYSQTSRFKNQRDHLFMYLPFVKDVVTKSCLASFSRTLASLNSAGVPLLDSIQISKRTMTNILFKRVADRLYSGIQLGRSAHEILEEETILPQMFVSMFRIGEETGELSSMVDKLAEFYEEEVTTSIKTLTSVLEPLMIVIVALVVAILLVAMYLPMFNMMTTVK